MTGQNFVGRLKEVAYYGLRKGLSSRAPALMMSVQIRCRDQFGTNAVGDDIRVA